MEKDLRAILERDFGGATLTPLGGGYTNQTCLMEMDGRRYVVKRGEPAAIKGEYEALRKLEGTGFAPLPVALYEEEGVCVTRFCAGTNAQALLDADLSIGEGLYKRLGRALKEIHSRTAGGDGLSLTHGDFGPHNALLEGERLTILDWEWARRGPRERDAAWVLWFAFHHYPEQARKWKMAFFTGYDLPLDDGALLPQAVSAVEDILTRARATAPEAVAEWEERLRWTRANAAVFELKEE